MIITMVYVAKFDWQTFLKVKLFNLNNLLAMLLCFEQVLLDSGATRDVTGHEMPNLIYVSREKRKAAPHHFKAGALNVLVRSIFYILVFLKYFY